MDISILKDPSSFYRAKAAKLGVSYGTVRNHLLGLRNGTPGGHTTFEKDVEQRMEDLLLVCASVGVPLSKALFKKASEIPPGNHTPHPCRRSVKCQPENKCC